MSPLFWKFRLLTFDNTGKRCDADGLAAAGKYLVLPEKQRGHGHQYMDRKLLCEQFRRLDKDKITAAIKLDSIPIKSEEPLRSMKLRGGFSYVSGLKTKQAGNDRVIRHTFKILSFNSGKSG